MVEVIFLLIQFSSNGVEACICGRQMLSGIVFELKLFGVELRCNPFPHRAKALTEKQWLKPQAHFIRPFGSPSTYGLGPLTKSFTLIPKFGVSLLVRRLTIQIIGIVFEARIVTRLTLNGQKPLAETDRRYEHRYRLPKQLDKTHKTLFQSY